MEHDPGPADQGRHPEAALPLGGLLAGPISHHCWACLPALQRAPTGADGGRPLGQVAATWIGRVASRESFGTWMVLARSHTARRLRELVRASREADSAWPPGLVPDAAPGGTAGLDPTGGLEAGPEAARPEEARRAEAGSDGAGEDPLAERCTLRMSIAAPVHSAFHETLDLHRAVEGGRASVASFTEALAAETSASGLDADDRIVPGVPGVPRARREAELARRGSERSARAPWSTLRPTSNSGCASPTSRHGASWQRSGPAARTSRPGRWWAAWRASRGRRRSG